MGFEKGNTHWKHPKSIDALKKNHTKPWNKGLKNPYSDEQLQKMSETKKGKHFSVNTEFKKGQNIGELNNQWKGEDVSYRNLHTWVERHLGKASACAVSYRGDCSKYFSWANVSHQYKRDLLDWLPLCYRHHKLHDLNRGGKLYV